MPRLQRMILNRNKIECDVVESGFSSSHGVLLHWLQTPDVPAGLADKRRSREERDVLPHGRARRARVRGQDLLGRAKSWSPVTRRQPRNALMLRLGTQGQPVEQRRAYRLLLVT